MKREIFNERFEELVLNLSVDQLEKLEVLLGLNYSVDGEVHNYKPLIFSDYIVGKGRNKEESRAIKQLLVIGFIIKNWAVICSKSISKNLQNAYNVYINRLAVSISDDSFDTEDIFWKELAVARLQFFPLHSGVMELYSGYGLKQGLGGSMLSSFRFCVFLALHGRKPYYQIHTHTPILENFSPEGWVKSYRQVAEFLQANPGIKGVIRGSWFFDPELKRVSPRLSYLQDMPLQHGAKIFCIGDDDSGNALIKSKSRLKLYNEGKYTPKSYLLIWLRKDILSWAKIK